MKPGATAPGFFVSGRGEHRCNPIQGLLLEQHLMAYLQYGAARNGNASAS
jgi:hypothetical protein